MRRRKSDKPLGLAELIAIALGGMVGGGIFTILGVSVATIGLWTPLAIALGGGLAALAAYSYVKLALWFRDEGATYSFFKRSFPHHDFAAALIGWWVVFGYISTIALYAFTFGSYAISGFAFADNDWARRGVAFAIIGLFAAINAWSTKGMGRVEDALVYTKIVILLIVAGVLLGNVPADYPDLLEEAGSAPLFGLLMVASVTFVAYEGFQLVIHAMHEMSDPERNIPRAIYSAVVLATLVYVVIAVGAVLTIPFENIINNQEYALAAGAADVIGPIGAKLVVAGALLATMSAISGTLFGASRLMGVIARDGNLPAILAHQPGTIPRRGIAAMAGLAGLMVAIGDLRMILEFGSITFLLVSILMALANHKLRVQTKANPALTVLALGGLSTATVLILVFEAQTQPQQLAFVVAIYALLTLGAWVFARR
ncbi:APC family permease [Actibacterium sp.]|uniref:APC family permease n=1 Tax=Actibacterium sp. TaxID=1872125 RepID=UPI003563CFA9